MNVTYRHIPEDTIDIPVMADGREMFVDSLTGNLKVNSTVRPHSSTFPTRWKIDNEWICKNGAKMDCEAPQKFAPNMDKIKKAIGYDEASGKTNGGIAGLHTQIEWEQAIFEEEKTKAVLQEFGRHLVTKNTEELVEHLALNGWWKETASGKLFDIFCHFATENLLGMIFSIVTIILSIFIVFSFFDWFNSARLRIQLLRNHNMISFRTVIMAILTPATFNIEFRNVPNDSKKKEGAKEEKEKEETKDEVIKALADLI